MKLGRIRNSLLCIFVVACEAWSDASFASLYVCCRAWIFIGCQSVAICDRDFLRYDSCVATLNVVDVFQTYDVLLLLDAFG